ELRPPGIFGHVLAARAGGTRQDTRGHDESERTDPVTRHARSVPVHDAAAGSDAAVCYPTDVRFLGVDYGRRRVGLALSDDTGTLARPRRTALATGAPRPGGGAARAGR